MENIFNTLGTFLTHLVDPWARWIAIVGAVLAAIWILVTVLSKSPHADQDINFILISCTVLIVCACVDQTSWFLILAPAYYCYALFFPLLMTNRARLFRPLYTWSSVIMVAVYTIAYFHYQHFTGFEWVWRLLLYALWGCLWAGFAYLMGYFLGSNVCPNCGYSGDHKKIKQAAGEPTVYECIFCGHHYTDAKPDDKKE